MDTARIGLIRDPIGLDLRSLKMSEVLIQVLPKTSIFLQNPDPIKKIVVVFCGFLLSIVVCLFVVLVIWSFSMYCIS